MESLEQTAVRGQCMHWRRETFDVEGVNNKGNVPVDGATADLGVKTQT